MSPRTRRQPPPEQPQPPPEQPPPTPDWVRFQQSLLGAQAHITVMGTELAKIPNMFQRWDENFAGIRGQLQEIKTSVDRLAMQLSLTEARRWNASQSHSVAIAVVPGRDPPAGFPATRTDFFSFPEPIVDAYLAYYSLVVPEGLAAKRQRLGLYLHIISE
ncbi:hypothetical protein L7F22_001566 [Adiantum nelumboides]|nr:hypothetical protein [Adiantum nelumboides]